MVNYIKSGNGMKKKILTMLVLMAVLLPSLFLFASCNKTDSAPTVSSITLVRSTGEEVSMFEYTYGAVTNPLRDISLKATYSDASTKMLDLTDSGIKMTYIYKTMNGSDEEAVELPALPDDNEYQAGVYEITISYSKQQIVVPIYVSQASAGGNFALHFKSTPQQSTTWDYANNPKLEDFINTLYVNGKTTYTPESTDIYYITLTEWQRLQQECGASGVGKYSLPNTAEAQTLLNEAEKEVLYNTLILPGDYVLIAKVPASNNYNEQFTVRGLGLTITKTILTETSNNIGRVIPLSYTTVDELTQGLQAYLLEGGDYIANDASLCIQDKQGNVYETDNFALGNTWVDLPNVVHYTNAHLQTYQRSCVPSYAYIRKVNADIYADSYSVDGFDFSQLTVKVQLNITPVTLSVDISKTITCSVHEYLGHMQEYTAQLYAPNAPEASLVQNLCTFSYTLNGEPVTYPTMAVSSSTRPYASVYMCIEEQSLAIGEYQMSIASAYPYAVVISGSNVASTITINPSTIVIDEDSYIPQNTFTPSAEGNVTIKIPLKWKGTLYSDLLTDASVINVKSLQLSMAPDSAVKLENAPFTVGTEENGQVYIQCTAKVTDMSGSNATATFTISGAANGAFYNTTIQIEATATVSKYTLQETDYIYTKAGTALNNNLSNSITLTQTSGEQFRFEDYIQVSTLTNAYGSWKICAFGGVDTPGEEINISTLIEAPETNRNYFLVFTSNNDMYCESVTLRLTVYASTIEA